MKNVNTEVTVTMTSREIAMLTGKEHKNVKRDIEIMMRQLYGEASERGGVDFEARDSRCTENFVPHRHDQHGDTLTFERIYFDSMDRQQVEYVLDREHTECLITGYSAELRMKVIRRVRELETAILENTQTRETPPHIEQADIRAIPAVFLRQIADLVEENEALKAGSKPSRKYTKRTAQEISATAQAQVKRSRVDPVQADAMRAMLATYPGNAVLLGGFIDRIRHRAPFKKAGNPARAAYLRKLIDVMVAEGLLVKCWDGRGVTIR